MVLRAGSSVAQGEDGSLTEMDIKDKKPILLEGIASMGSKLHLNLLISSTLSGLPGSSPQVIFRFVLLRTHFLICKFACLLGNRVASKEGP